MPTIKRDKQRKIDVDYTINTDNLKIGQQLKYAELCELIGAPVVHGDSKKAQLANTGELSFKRYFNFEKIGRGVFEITDIYDTPLPAVDGRQYGNNSVYSQYIELILMQYLGNRRGHVEIFSKHKLWLLLGMINNRYSRVRQTTLEKQNPILTQYEVNHFYQRSNRKLSSILRSALNNLKARRLIEWKEETIIQGKNGNWFTASDEQEEEIIKAEREVLKSYGYEKIFQIYSSFKQKKFFDDVMDILYDRFKWNEFSRRIKIIYNKENIIDAIPQTEIKLQKELLNNEVSNFLNNQAKQFYSASILKYDKAIEEELMETGTISQSLNTFCPPDTYIAAQKLLVDELINIGNKQEYVSLDQMISMSALEEIDSLFPI